MEDEHMKEQPGPRLTLATKLVLAAFMNHLLEGLHGYDLMKMTGLSSGSLYPILHRLEKYQLITGEWEEEIKPGKPRRRKYTFTPTGIVKAELLGEELLRFREALLPHPRNRHPTPDHPRPEELGVI